MDRLVQQTALRGYALCAEPRCGSTYLARLCASTGVLGHPREYFSGLDHVNAANADPDGHLRTWLHQTTTPNGVYGLKIFADQFDLVTQSRWADRLPSLSFIHIERRDVLGQAISLVRARQTLVYDSEQGTQRKPVYSHRSIAAALDGILLNQARWGRWFARNGIMPLRLTYEDIVADPKGTVRQIAERLGLQAPLPSQPPMSVQRDQLSQEWRERFVAESRDVAYLGYLAPPIRPRLGRLKQSLRQLASSLGSVHR